MKTLKQLFLITSLLLFGGFLLASDSITPTTEGDESKSNPPKCKYICKTEPAVSGGAMNDRNLGCGEILMGITNPDEGPNITQGELVCENDASDIKAVELTYSWTLDDSSVDYSSSGVYVAFLDGTATLSRDECPTNASDLNLSLPFFVTIEALKYVSPGKLLLCETLPVKVNCGDTPLIVKSISPQNPGIVEVIGSNKIKGLSHGTVKLDVETAYGIVEGEVTVSDCKIVDKPKFEDLKTTTNKASCEETPHGFRFVTIVEAKFNYIEGESAQCLENGNIKNRDIKYTEQYAWTSTGNIKFLGNQFTSQVRIYTIDNSELEGKLTLDLDADWNVCGESGHYDEEATVDFSDDSVSGKFLIPSNPPAFAPQNKFSAIDIHGKPNSIVKPQQEQEQDHYKSDFNLDTYNLSPSFSTADISIPLKGTDLRLELRRKNSTDVTTESNLDNIPHRTIMGRTWRTNLTPVLYTYSSSTGGTGVIPNQCSGPPESSGDAYIVVIDDQGSEFKYSNTDFQPIKKHFSDFESALHKLSGVVGETLYFTKQNGTVFEYVPVNFQVTNTVGEDFSVSMSTSLTGFHRLKSITDRMGNKIEYQYETDDSLLPEKLVYAQNPEMNIEFRYSPDGIKLTKAIDPLGQETNYEYDENGNLKKVIKTAAPVANPSNPKETNNEVQEYNFTYNNIVIQEVELVLGKFARPGTKRTTHFLESMVDPELNTIQTTYKVYQSNFKTEFVALETLTTPDGTLSAEVLNPSIKLRNVRITDTSNHQWDYSFLASTINKTYTYSSSEEAGLLKSETELLLNSFSRKRYITPDLSDTMRAEFITDLRSTINLDYVIDYHGIKTQYVYGTQPVTYFRNGVQVTEAYDFGAHNQPYQEILDPDGLNIVKEFGYEPNTNQMVRIVDGNGNVTTYDIDNQGNRLREIAPEGKVTTFTYDLGFQTSATDADGRRTESSRVYDDTGWTDTSTVTGYNNELNITTSNRFNLVGKLIQSVDANGNATDNEYDDTNALVRTILPPVINADAENDTPVRPVILFTRDKNRQVVGKQDSRGNWTITEYDGMLRPVKATIEVSSNEAENIITETEYDAAGNKSAVIDPRGTRYEFKYDSFNNLIEEIKDVGGENLTSTYEYGEGSGNDVFGDTGFVPTKKVDPRGISTLLEYDNAYRLTRTYRGFEDRESLLSEITYDDAGNVIKTLTFNNQLSNLSGEYIGNTAGLTSGNQENITEYDSLNRPVSTAVDLDGDGASTQDTDDIITNTFYDLSGNVIITIDAEGHSSQTEYDGAGRVIKQLVNLDDDPQFGEIASNQYAIIAQDVDIVTTKSYDGNGNVLTETIHNNTPNAVGDQTVVKTYDALNRPQTVQDPEGNITETKYDLNNNARYIKNGRGFETITEYDEANRAIKQTLPEVFNAEANNGLGANENPEVLTFYDTNSNVVKTIDARNLVTLNSYDALNRLEETRQVIGTDDRASDETNDIVSENGYDENNNLVETKFFREDETLITSTVYDALDRPLITIDPEGFQSVVFCDLVGNKVKLFDKRANTKIVNNEEVKDAIPQLRYFTQVTFDRANRMIKNTLPEIPLASRDEFGDVNEENIQPFSEVVYLKNNWVDSTIDLNGNETSTIYDNAGRKLTVTNAIGQEISYIYDKSSNVLVQTVENNVLSGGNQVTTYTYDKRNLLKTETLNKDHATLERVYEYTYDENGNKKTRIFPNGDTTTYNYDALDRLNSEVYTNAADENRTYNYNNNGAVITCTDDTGTVKYEYDILGRQVSEIKLNSNDIAVSEIESIYDKANNRIRCFFPSEKKTLISLYDKRNLLTTMKGFHGKILSDDEGTYPGQAEITTYTYNANGTQLSNTLPNGQTTTKVFDQADRIINSTTSSVILTETINSYTAQYKRDAVGNQLQAIETRSVANGGGTRTRTLNFIYDDTYRLTVESDDLSGEIVVNTYIYDLQGNRTSRIQKTNGENDQDSWIYTNDILNRTTAVQIDLKGIDRTSSYSYSYDTNGNREIRTHINEDSETSTHTYSYDQENRLTNVNDGSDDIFKASYDYRTRRTAKTEVNAQDQFETVSYIYDGGVSCQEVKVTTPGDEYDGTNGSLDKQYIRGNGMGGGIGSVCYMERPADFGSVSSDVQNFYDTAGYGPTDLNGSSNMLAEYYAYNAVGSVVANTDQQGFVIRENDFDAYGRVVREEDHTPNNFPIEFGGSQNDLLFSTKERDYSTGLDNFGFRYYDSVLGKFITRDPSGYPDGPNNYLYVNNNPINSIDPLGLKTDKSTEEIQKALKESAERANPKAETAPKNAPKATPNATPKPKLKVNALSVLAQALTLIEVGGYVQMGAKGAQFAAQSVIAKALDSGFLTAKQARSIYQNVMKKIPRNASAIKQKVFTATKLATEMVTKQVMENIYPETKSMTPQQAQKFLQKEAALEWQATKASQDAQTEKRGERKEVVWDINDKYPLGSEESVELNSFVFRWNIEVIKNGGSMTRRKLSEQEESDSKSWRAKTRSDNSPQIFNKGDGLAVGHIPDAAAGGPASGGSWMPLNKSVNSSIGSQVGKKPVGYTYNRVRTVRKNK